MKRLIAALLPLILLCSVIFASVAEEIVRTVSDGEILTRGDFDIHLEEDTFLQIESTEPLDASADGMIEEIEGFELYQFPEVGEETDEWTPESPMDAEAASNGLEKKLKFPIEIKNNRGNSGIYDFSLEDCVFATVSTEYNPKLADMLMAISAAAYNTTKKHSGELTVKKAGYNIGKSEKWNENNQELYYITKAYHDLGFDHYEAFNYYNDPNALKYGSDNAAFVIGAKDVFDDESLVLIAVRGSYGNLTDMTSDWQSNLKITTKSDGRHYGFATATDKIYSQVMDYLKKRYSGKYIKSNIRYVITGHSRGAGVANLLAVKLMDKGVRKYRVYDYNFACPDVARKSVGFDWQEGYDNVFNITNTADVVGLIPGVIGNLGGTAVTKSLLSLFTSWGKFGRSFYYCKNWNQLKEFDLARILDDKDSPHDCKNYVNYMKKRRTDFHSWAEVAVRRSELIVKNDISRIIMAFYPGAAKTSELGIPVAPIGKTGDNGSKTVYLTKKLQLIPQFTVAKGWFVRSWTSSNAKVAKVNAAGVVLAKKEGVAEITAKTFNGKSAKVKIIVTDPSKPTKITLDRSSATIIEGKTLQLNATMQPSTAKSRLTWSTSDKKVATVSSTGVVTAKKKGTAKITVKTENGKKATIKIEVKSLSNKEIHKLYEKKANQIKKEEGMEWVKIKYIEITGDDIDEAVALFEHYDPAFSYAVVLTYAGGKVKTFLELGDYSFYDITFYPKTKTLIWHGGGHEDDWYDIYTLKSGKFKYVAGKYREYDWKSTWDTYYDGKRKETTKQNYDKLTKDLLKGKVVKVF